MNNPNGSSDGNEPGNRLWTSAYVRALIADFCFFGSAQALIPVCSLYLDSLGAGTTTVGIAAGTFMGVAVFLRPFTGWLVDAFGRRSVFVLTAMLFAFAGLGLPLWPSILPLIFFRFLQGIAWSAAVTASTTLQSDVIPARRRGEGIGYVSSVRNLATAIAPALALSISSSLGVEYAIWFSVVVGFIAAASVFLVYDNCVVSTTKPPFEWGKLIEKSALAPALINATMMFVFGIIVTFVPLDAQRRSIGDPAHFFFLFSLMLMVVRPAAGRWSDAVSNRTLIVVPGLISIVCAVWILVLLESPWTLTIVAVLWAFGFGVVQPIVRTLVLERAPARRWGAANATMLTFYDLGMAAGPLSLGFVAGTYKFETMYAISSAPLSICILLILLGVFQPWRIANKGCCRRAN